MIAAMVNPTVNIMANPTSTPAYLALLRLALPEVLLVAAALLAIALDLFLLRASSSRVRVLVSSAVAIVGCSAAILRILLVSQSASLFDGSLIANPQTSVVQLLLLALTILLFVFYALLPPPEDVGECTALLLFATVGMMFLVATQNLLLLFLSLELLSLSLYLLAGFDRRSRRSAEASLKYFLFGATSAAFTLFGFSLLYGFSHSINLASIAVAVQQSPRDPLLLLAVVMTLVGFGFKIAAVPFHFWAPDVYQGAPTIGAMMIASTSKLAGFLILYRLLTLGLAPLAGSAAPHSLAPGWLPVLAAMSALSMIFGNVAALAQSSVRRLIAYSAIAHSGYAMLALFIPTGFSALAYYLVTYSLTVIGAFAVVALVESTTGSDALVNFSGLSRRMPIVSCCMLVFMLSLAGIPPLAGFFGKFYLFTSLLNGNQVPLSMLWLVVLAIVMSAISLYYYLRVLKQIYVAAPFSENSGNAPLSWQIALSAVALAIVLLGCLPNLLLRWLS